MLRVEFMKNNI